MAAGAPGPGLRSHPRRGAAGAAEPGLSPAAPPPAAGRESAERRTGTGTGTGTGCRPGGARPRRHAAVPDTAGPGRAGARSAINGWTRPASPRAASAAPAMGSEAAALLEAADFAARKHKGQRRKDPEGTPFINHPIGAETRRHPHPRPWESPRTRVPLPGHRVPPGDPGDPPPAPERRPPPGAPHPGPWREPDPLSCATSLPPSGGATPLPRALPTPGRQFSPRVPSLPCPTAVFGRGGSPHAVALPGTVPTGAAALARSCPLPSPLPTSLLCVAGVARILAHEAGVTDIVVLQVTTGLTPPSPPAPRCGSGPGPPSPRLSPAGPRPPSCTTRWRTRTPPSRRSRSGSGRR